MNRGELVRLRRCRLLLLAMAFGLLLPAFQRSWAVLGVAAAGEAILGFAWWRACGRPNDEPTSHGDPTERA